VTRPGKLIDVYEASLPLTTTLFEEISGIEAAQHWQQGKVDTISHGSRVSQIEAGPHRKLVELSDRPVPYLRFYRPYALGGCPQDCTTSA